MASVTPVPPMRRRRLLPVAGLVAAVAAAGRLRQGRTAGHVGACRRERAAHRRPAAADVRHRRRRRSHRVRRRRLRRREVQGPWPGRSPSRPTATRSSRSSLTILPAIILAGVAVPTVSTVFELDQDRRHRVRHQRHRPAVVVGVRLPTGKCGGGRDHRAHRHQRRAGHPGRHDGAAAHHQPRRHPQLLDPEAQRQARRRARSPAHAAHAGRRARHLHRPVHRVLRPQPRRHAPGGRRAERSRLPDVGRQPARSRTPRPRPARWPPPAKPRSSPTAASATR